MFAIIPSITFRYRRMSVRKYVSILLAAACLCAGAVAQAATFTGKVTKSDGVTPIANVRVGLYRHDPDNPVYPLYKTAYTDALGKYTVSADLVGVYLVHFSVTSSSDQQGWAYPFQSYYYYQDLPLDKYRWETYNDVTSLTPTKPPTQFVVADLGKVFKLVLVKLDTIPPVPDCLVTGPITVNGTPYSSFSAYSGGPSLPDAGGTLNIGLKVTNLTPAAISTNLQAVAFLERDDTTYADGDRAVRTFARKAQTLPASSTTPVSLSVAIPGALMTARPTGAYGLWAFNLGVQMTTLDGVPNCKEILLPVHHVPTSAIAAQREFTEGQAEQQGPSEIIPLSLSETGQVLEWGPAPRRE
jgi:hypothetical protein